MNKNQKPCPICGGPMHRQSKRCRKCRDADPVWRQHLSEVRKGKPSYERTEEHRRRMSEALTGMRRSSPSASTRPEVAQKIREWWTPERREAKRQEMLARNPDARYHGLSAKGARRLRKALGHCEVCGDDGSGSRLDVHHRNGDKQDQSLGNLTVLCHRCHMQIHGEQGETGWDSYHQKRKTNPD